MSYINASQYAQMFSADELAQRTDRNRDGAQDYGVFERAAELADGEIDGYLAARYRLPLPSVPPMILRVAAYLTRYHLFGQGRTEEIRQDYLDAVKLLRDVASGTAKLGLPVPVPAATNEADLVEVDAPARVFTSGTLSDFTQSQNGTPGRFC